MPLDHSGPLLGETVCQGHGSVGIYLEHPSHQGQYPLRRQGEASSFSKCGRVNSMTSIAALPEASSSWDALSNTSCWLACSFNIEPVIFNDVHRNQSEAMC